MTNVFSFGRALAAAFLGMLFWALLGTASAQEPTAAEVHFVELLNRARANPAAEAARYGIRLNEGVPVSDTISTAAKPPLAINGLITAAARYHAEDMISRSYFDHYTEGSGTSPQQRCQAAGYNYYSGENIAIQMSTATLGVDQTTAETLHGNLFVDEGYPDRGHRTNLMNASHVEVGVGMASGYPYIMSSGDGWYAVDAVNDFGRPSAMYICGVIYNDTDGDSFYDVGEGLTGAAVTVVEANTTVNAFSAGAYSVAVASSGTYTVRVTVSGSTATKTVTVNGANTKLDFTAADFGGSTDTGGTDSGGTDTGGTDTGGTDTGGTDTGTTDPGANLDGHAIGWTLTDSSGDFKNSSTISAGEYAALYYGFGAGSSGVGDIYIALAMNDAGILVTVPGTDQVSANYQILPYATGVAFGSDDVTRVITLRPDSSWPSGKYDALIVVTAHGANVLDTANWVFSDMDSFYVQ